MPVYRIAYETEFGEMYYPAQLPASQWEAYELARDTMAKEGYVRAIVTTTFSVEIKPRKVKA